MSLKAAYCINETTYLSHPSLRPVLHAGKLTAQFNLPLNSAVSCLFSQFPLFDQSGRTHEYHFPSDVLQCTAVVWKTVYSPHGNLLPVTMTCIRQRQTEREKKIFKVLMKQIKLAHIKHNPPQTSICTPLQNTRKYHIYCFTIFYVLSKSWSECQTNYKNNVTVFELNYLILAKEFVLSLGSQSTCTGSQNCLLLT
jgi:hypothetical protein